MKSTPWMFALFFSLAVGLACMAGHQPTFVLWFKKSQGQWLVGKVARYASFEAEASQGASPLVAQSELLPQNKSQEVGCLRT